MSHTMDNNTNPLTAQLDALNLNAQALRPSNTDVGYAGEAEEWREGHAGGGQGASTRSRPDGESGGNWSKVATHGSRLRAGPTKAYLNPEDHHHASPLTCTIPPSMREGVVADGSQAYKSNTTKNVDPAK